MSASSTRRVSLSTSGFVSMNGGADGFRRDAYLPIRKCPLGRGNVKVRSTRRGESCGTCQWLRAAFVRAAAETARAQILADLGLSANTVGYGLPGSMRARCEPFGAGMPAVKN